MAVDDDLAFFAEQRRAMNTLFALERHLSAAAVDQLTRDWMKLQQIIKRARAYATYQAIKQNFDEQMRRAHGSPE